MLMNAGIIPQPLCRGAKRFCHAILALMKAHSLYVHIPFCTHRCGYCDFNTYAGLEHQIPAYVDALVAEVEWVAANSPSAIPVHTVFFGGGTPSLLPAESIARILDAVRANCELAADAEISLEANPGSLRPGYLAALRAAGVNRLSLGVQSASPEELRLLERLHSYEDVIAAVKLARQEGFENLNLDLIFALPGQPLAAWQHNLELALDLAPEHFSLYALTIEHGTPFQKMADRGLLTLTDPDLAADMYEWAMQRLAEAGYEQYEISNWAQRREGQLLACRHNLQYWRNLPYFGLGAGAHGFVAGHRTVNALAPAAYIERVSGAARPAFPRTPATIKAQPVDAALEMGETMMMGLRLLEEGVSQTGFAERFGRTLDEVYGEVIAELQASGLLENGGDRLRLTARGQLLGNRVFREFI